MITHQVLKYWSFAFQINSLLIHIYVGLGMQLKIGTDAPLSFLIKDLFVQIFDADEFFQLKLMSQKQKKSIVCY